MTRVFIAATRPEDRTALRLLLHDLKFEVVGEASDWATTLIDAPARGLELLVVESGMLPRCPSAELDTLRRTCASAVSIVLLSHLDPYQQAARASGADIFISEAESPERVAGRFRILADAIHAEDPPVALMP